MTNSKNARNNTPETSAYAPLLPKELEAYISDLEKAFDPIAKSSTPPFEKLQKIESLAKQLDHLENFAGAASENRLAAFSQKLLATQKALANGALEALKSESQKIPLTLKEAPYQLAAHRSLFYLNLRQQANKLYHLPESLLSASEKASLAPLLHAIEQHFTTVEKKLRENPIKNKVPEDFHTYFTDHVRFIQQESREKSIEENIEKLKSLVTKLDFLSYVQHKIKGLSSDAAAGYQDVYKKSCSQVEDAIGRSLEQRIQKLQTLMQKPLFSESPLLYLKGLRNELKIYDVIFSLPREFLSEDFIERMEQMKKATLSFYYTGQLHQNYGILDTATQKKEKNPEDNALSHMPKQNPLGNTRGLEEACLQLKHKSTQLKLKRISAFGMAPAQDITLSKPEQSIRPGDILFRGEAARIFSAQLQKRADPDAVYKVLQQSHPKDIFRVSDPASPALQDFLAAVERERMQKMLQEKMQPMKS